MDQTHNKQFKNEQCKRCPLTVYMYSSICLLLFITTVAFFSTAGHTVESAPLEGTFFVSPESYIDPSPNEKNTHYRISLKGQSAKELYDLMDSEIQLDQCTGVESKTVGAMQCFLFKNKRGYECHFSIDVKNQKIEYGLAC